MRAAEFQCTAMYGTPCPCDETGLRCGSVVAYSAKSRKRHGNSQAASPGIHVGAMRREKSIAVGCFVLLADGGETVTPADFGSLLLQIAISANGAH